jgi:two-component system, cell cycle sensor histidine kinase and response regulator CckA
MLERLGYVILTAGDGEEAVTLFKANQDKIRLLLFDVIMPKKNGKEAYDEIRKLNPEVKCLFMSGYTADVISRRGMLDEDMHFLSKPVSIQDLSKKIREILDGTTTSVT